MAEDGLTGFENFESSLSKLSSGLSKQERLVINNAGANEFERIIKPKIPKRKNTDEDVHLVDTLEHDELPNGSINVGFSKAGKKAYIGRLLNDGWDKRHKDGSYKHINGLHFFEQADVESREPLEAAMTAKTKQIINQKAGHNL
ncbi:hypothetical protein WJM93_15495 [Lactiplantibacillus plantarum]|uniref:hypothetical protein n=1 Tax=Lactiplantibacillus plantarum TaxID=1590 RepID=UPI0030A6950C